MTIPVFTLFGETEAFPDIVHCERFKDRAPTHGWTISAHRHAQMTQLFWIEEGNASAQVDTAEITLSDGSFLYIPEHCVHSFVFSTSISGYVLSFPLSVVKSVVPANDEVLRALSRPLQGKTTDALGDLIEALMVMYEQSGRFRAQSVLGLSHAILAKLAETAEPEESGARHRESRIARLNALIAKHMSDGWTAAQYASELSVSVGHLSRTCRAAAGVGATRYIEQAVIEEACRMLAFTQLSVAEVGYRLGFQDPSYFSKRFRHLRGQSPSDYRTRFTG